jgi:hypothetical protein
MGAAAYAAAPESTNALARDATLALYRVDGALRPIDSAR